MTGFKKNCQKWRKELGITLIEMMVAILIFSLSVVAITGLFISSLRSQQRILASQILLDQTSYTLEYMSRALRMAKKELGEGCLSQSGLNYEIPEKYRINGNRNLGRGLRFINHLEGNDCQEFFLENNQLKYKKKVGGHEETLDFTSTDLEVTSLRFQLAGQSQDDNLQPRVTVFLDIKRRGSRPGEPAIKIQTTISQRNLDIRY